MARTRRVKKSSDAYYHIISRTNNREFLFNGDTMKEQIKAALLKSAAFSGVELKAYCIMDNHFHVVCKVGKPEVLVSESEILQRIKVLKGELFARQCEDRWAKLRGNGGAASVENELNNWRRRMNDVSEFTKTFKELITITYKRDYLKCHGEKHIGIVWSGRFKSTLIQDGEYLRTCVRYVELNPVRAGIVRRAADYAFSSRNGEQPAQFFVLSSSSSGTVPAWGGTVPERCEVGDERLMKRMVQIGEGKIFGSERFVMAMKTQMGTKFYAKHVGLHSVVAGAYSTHGHNIAKEVAA